ncbi:MAG: MFS transporter [Desulfobulbaceae bacterium]|nr:MAG: MFS transporter [Desulfobulbaceae bacterium]
MSKLSTSLSLRIFLPFAVGYFLSYLFRVVNAVISTDLVADTGIGPSALGLLTAIYFITFASFQLPLGILLDRFGPRKTESVLLLFAAIGAFLFAQAESLMTLVIGRAFIGFGVSACLMAAFKAYALWFSSERWPLINGLQMAAGGMGALAATSPVEYLLGITDWRGLFLLLAALTFVVSLLVFFVVPEHRTKNAEQSLKKQVSGIKTVFTSMKFWRAAPVTTMSQASFLAIQGLWVGPWLRDVAGYDRAQSADLMFWIALCMVAGFMLLGGLAERLSRKGIPVMTTAVSGMGLFMVVQFLIVLLPASSVIPLWFLFGFSGTSGIIAYAALSQDFPVELSGRVTTAVNLLVFVAAFAGQWAIGAVIEQWPLLEDGGYGEAGFKAGFIMMLIFQLLSLGWFFVATKLSRRLETTEHKSVELNED